MESRTAPSTCLCLWKLTANHVVEQTQLLQNDHLDRCCVRHGLLVVGIGFKRARKPSTQRFAFAAGESRWCLHKWRWFVVDVAKWYNRWRCSHPTYLLFLVVHCLNQKFILQCIKFYFNSWKAMGLLLLFISFITRETAYFRGITPFSRTISLSSWLANSLRTCKIQVCTFHDGCKQGIDQQILIGNRFHVKLRILSP